MANMLNKHIRVDEAHWKRITAQAIARDMIAAGREDKLEQIRRDVSQLAPDLPDEQTKPASTNAVPSDSMNGDT